MADNPKDILYLAAEDIGVAINDRGYVCIIIKHPPSELGLAPGLALGIPLTPNEALGLGDNIKRLAGIAQCKLS